MSKVLTLLPEDRIIVVELARILAKRLVNNCNTVEERRGLLRMLFAFQRLPVLLPGASMSISAGRQQIQIDADHCAFVSYTEDWQTEFRAQCFVGATVCIDGYELLQGREKLEAARYRLSDFAVAMEESDGFSVEDYSNGVGIEEPPFGFLRP